MSKKLSKQNEQLIKNINAVMEDKESQTDLIQNLIHNYSLETQFGELIVRKFVLYSNNDYETFKTYVEKLYHSFQQIQKESDVALSLHNRFEFHQMLELTFMNVIRKMKAGQVKNVSSYLYIAFLNCFRNIARIIKNEQSNSLNSLFDYTKNEY